ncbi:MAG: hypothetical protein CMI00_10385 [Oceanospirillaceae bacterium]|nr:hypothetical protein [Oceanospirillaceae bacterium]|tara:strand:- start:25023 stop:25544 length:522 start_codon:yes stop_codon:yes gene_type:complete
MFMKQRWFIFTLWFLIVTAVTVPVSFYLTPYAFMTGVRLVTDLKADENTMFHARVPDHTNDMVVMTSPDLLYSLCVYDLSDTDLLVESDVPDAYWSVSFFGADTMNYYSTNDRKVATPAFRKIVTTDPTKTGPDYVLAPDTTGAVIIRIGFTPDTVDALRQVQLSGQCRPTSA